MHHRSTRNGFNSLHAEPPNAPGWCSLAAGKFLLAASSSSHARTVAELKASVAVLCENDETNTPLLKECDDTCRKLSSSLTTMEHAVKDITSSLSAVSSMATELTSLLQERGDVEQQKWSNEQRRKARDNPRALQAFSQGNVLGQHRRQTSR